MADLENTKTVAVKGCPACGAGLLEHNKFCRRCGAGQPNQSVAAVNDTSRVPEIVDIRRARSSPFATNAVEEGDLRPSSYRTVSGSLVRAVIVGMSAKAPAQIESRIARGAALTLISITIWLIVVLLSPLDAYGAVKAISDQA